MIELPLRTRRDTVRLGAAIAKALQPGDLLTLAGGLGAGKTFLVRALCRALGVEGEHRITSPTFTLVHEYEAQDGRRLHHADLYRLRGTKDPARELTDLGLRSARSAGDLILIEWPQGFEAYLGGPADLHVHLELAAKGRLATLSGARSEHIFKEKA